jgi:DNA-directed RNA polymerase sigma subunit (sigma70/sigma32)
MLALLEKFAAKKIKDVKVKEHVRHQGKTTTVVDAHVRHQAAEEDDGKETVEGDVNEPFDESKAETVTIDDMQDAGLVVVDAPSEDEVNALTKTKAQELDFWKKWKSGGKTQKDAAPVLKSLTPVINRVASAYMRNRVPPEAIRLEAFKQALVAMDKYDPTKGASIGTFVYGYVNFKLKRFIAQHQNISRIPEERIHDIGKLKAAEHELNEQLGRPPTNEELAGYMGRSAKTIETLRKENRKDLWSENFDVDKGGDPASVTTSRMETILGLIRPELNDQEKKVFDLIMSGVDKPGDIVKATKLPAYKVSRLKASIAKKIDKYGH